MIYAILDEWGGSIKIGYTKSDKPNRRIKDLQCGASHRLECVGFIKGDFEKEAYIHNRCSIHHTNGGKEWIELNEVTIPYLKHVFDFKPSLVRRLYHISEEYQARKRLILG